MTGAHDHLRETDLAPLVETHGDLTLDPVADTFQRLVVAVVRQQVSTSAARAIEERLFDQFDVTPSVILDADREALRSVGLSRQKADYVTNIARAYDEQGYSKAYFDDLTDEEVVDELTAIKGIGDWTAKIFLMFCLGREDVFPVEDLGVRRGMEQLYGDLSRGEMVECAESWRPYRSYASLYLWRSVD